LYLLNKFFANLKKKRVILSDGHASFCYIFIASAAEKLGLLPQKIKKSYYFLNRAYFKLYNY